MRVLAPIVDAQEPPPAAGRGRWLALATVAGVLLVFAATLEPVQRTARTALGLAGFVPLAVTLSGVVTNEGGSPIAHAFVRVDQDRELAATYTDETGSYRMAFTIRTADPADVSFGANGYEVSLRELHVASTEPQYDAQLHPLVRIDGGASVHLVVSSEDGLCYPARSDVRDAARSWPCRLVHVLVRQTGILSVMVVPDDPGNKLGVSFPVGSEPMIVFATPCCPQSEAARLPEGADGLVQIVALDLETTTTDASRRGRQGFTLRTTIEPP